MPLDLELLRNGDAEEWEQTWTELDLWAIAKASVERVIGSQFPQSVEDVAADALSELTHTAIHRCDAVRMVVPMLRKIGKNRAIDRRRRFWERFVAAQSDDLFEHADESQSTIRDRMERVSDLLHLDGNLDSILDALVANAELNLMEEGLLKEHIVEGLTQQEFADKYGIPLGSVGRVKNHVLRKVKLWLGGFDVK